MPRNRHPPRPRPHRLWRPRLPHPRRSQRRARCRRPGRSRGLVTGLHVETDVPYTDPLPCEVGECTVPLDILAPEEGDALPTIVLLPGGPGAFHERRYLEALATELAQRDAVVFLATYRSEATGSSADTSVSDVRCAIRYARSRTGEFGGDPDRLVLVGHSFGSHLALGTAANADADTPGCLADAPGNPDAAVGLAGFLFAVDDPADADLSFLLMSGSDDPAAAMGRPARRSFAWPASRPSTSSSRGSTTSRSSIQASHRKSSTGSSRCRRQPGIIRPDRSVADLFARLPWAYPAWMSDRSAGHAGPAVAQHIRSSVVTTISSGSSPCTRRQPPGRRASC